MTLDTKFMIEALPEIIKYVPVTLRLALGALLIALVFSGLFAFILLKKVPVLDKIVKVYLSVIRGTPIILQMFVIYKIAPSVLQAYFTKIHSGIDIFEIDNSWYAYLALSLSATAFFTEAIRAAILSVDKGQLEAAYMVGMTAPVAFWRIILPQAIGVALPIMCNTIVDTVKATSLAFAMAVTEVTGAAKILGGMSLRYFEAYLDIFFVYLILIFAIEFLLKRLEKWLVRYRKATA